MHGVTMKFTNITVSVAQMPYCFISQTFTPVQVNTYAQLRESKTIILSLRALGGRMWTEWLASFVLELVSRWRCVVGCPCGQRRNGSSWMWGCFVHRRSGRFGGGNSPVPVQGVEQRIFGCPVRSVVTTSAELSELHNTRSVTQHTFSYTTHVQLHNTHSVTQHTFSNTTHVQ